MNRKLKRAGIALVLVIAAAMFISAQVDASPPDPVAVFNQAQDRHEHGDLAGAVNLYQKALAAMPEFPEAEYQLGVALASLGKKDEAADAFHRAAKLRPEWALPYSAAGRILLERGKFAEAGTELNKALELQPADPLALSVLADLRVKTKASEPELRSLLERITSITSKANPPSTLLTAKAALETALGKPVAARLSLERAVAANPSDVGALLQLADTALQDGDIERSRSLAGRVETLAPALAGLHLLKANILLRSGDTGGALKELEALPATDQAAAGLRAQILANTNANAAELEQQLAAAPNSAALLGRLCTLYRRSDPVKALSYCRRASEAEPNNIDHAIGFGAALVQAKQYEQAVGVLRKLTEFAPQNWTAHANLATALFQMNRLAEAKLEYDWLAQKQPEAAAPHLFLGLVHDRLGEFREAMLEYKAYLKLADPAENKLDIDKVKLRLPSLENDIKKGKKN